MTDPRAGWIAAGTAAAAGEPGPIRCPQNDDADLAIDWLPASQTADDGGEYRLRCPGCGAENYVLIRQPRS